MTRPIGPLAGTLAPRGLLIDAGVMRRARLRMAVDAMGLHAPTCMPAWPGNGAGPWIGPS